MNNKDIMECLQDQLGKPVKKRKEVEENKLFILDGIIAGDLPVYRKWVWTSFLEPKESIAWIFRIDIIEGRLECDRIKFEDKGRVEFDTGNHSVVLDSEFEAATQDEWKNGLHKLMKYLRNGN